MRNWGKAPQILVALNCVCFSVAHADDAAPATTPVELSSAPAPEAPTVQLRQNSCCNGCTYARSSCCNGCSLRLFRQRLPKRQHQRVQVQQ